jgi:hypothetical protein
VAIGSEPARADEHVDVGMVEHGAGPGVKDGQTCGPAAEITWVGGQLEKRLRRRPEQGVVDGFRMGARQSPQRSGQCEGDQVVGTGEQTAALASQPSLTLIPVTLGTVPVATRMIGIDVPATGRTRIDVASKERRSAMENIPESALLGRTQPISGLLAKRRAVEADDVGHLQHDGLGFRGRSSDH